MSFVNIGLFSGYDLDWLQDLTLDGSFSWGKYNFFVNNSEKLDTYDFIVCAETLMNPYGSTDRAPYQILTHRLEKEKLIFLTLEPPSYRNYPTGFLNQFGYIFAHAENISHPGMIQKQPAHKWFVKKTMNQLRHPFNENKTRFMSIVCSSKQFSLGHAKRLEFAMKLKSYFGEMIDLWGRGIRDFDDKWDVLSPYKYSIAIENSCFHNWMTEKLPDCYLAQTFPLYCGCPNVNDYFDQGSLEIIDLDNFSGAVAIIEKLIDNPFHYEHSIPTLVQQKYKYLFKYSFLPSLCNLLDHLFLFPTKSSNSPFVQIYPESFFAV
jgi:hypothetical protein